MNYEQYTLSVIYHASMKGIPLNCNKSGLTLFQEAKQALINEYINRKNRVRSVEMLSFEWATSGGYFYYKESKGYLHLLPSEYIYHLLKKAELGQEVVVAHLVLSDGEVIEAVCEK